VTAAIDHALATGQGPRAMVLVEGVSDQAALTTLAQRRGRDLAAEGVAIVPLGGASGIGRMLGLLGRQRRGVRLAGLCDAAEERDFRQALEQAGFGAGLTRAGLERLGFYVCVADLEDELIRCLGFAAVERLVDDQGELASWRRFQRQLAQRGRAPDRQLRRFMGARAGRKLRYARLLVEALDLARVPRPLDRVLAHV
jgi:hypothetical protein